MKISYPVQISLILLGLVIISTLSYLPGLSGGFLLDDISNLQSLSRYGGIKNSDTFLLFVFDGASSFLGRPISLATFVLNAQAWPADPLPFKITNLLIHVINTIILFALLLKLLKLTGKQAPTAHYVATLATLLWSIHPLQISTVFYVIQRMTELAALFIFIGIWCYLHGRSKLSEQPKQAFIWMSLAITVCGALAALSKENGVLLPLLILVIEFTLLNQLPKAGAWHKWALIFIAIPITVIISYLGLVIFNHTAQYAGRDFTLYERLLTQGRVLIDYLVYILVPSTTPSLLHDDIVLSKGLFNPYTTLLSLLIITAAIVAAVRIRKQLPVISFAILWFFAAHLLESTVIPLELYYEHRNYLPLVGPAFAIGYYLANLIGSRFNKAGLVCSVLLISILGVTTWNYSTTWSDNDRLAATWYKERPTSLRNTIRHVIGLMQQGDVETSYAITSKLIEQHPEKLGSHIFHITISCLAQRVTQTQYNALVDIAKNHYIDAAIFSRYTHLFNLVKQRQCTQISYAGSANLTEILIKNPYVIRNNSMLAQLHLLMSELYVAAKRIKPAIHSLEMAYQVTPSIDILLKKVQLLAAVNEYERAEAAVAQAITLDENRGALIPSRREDLNYVLEKLKEAKN